MIWARAEWVAAPRLDRPKVVAFDASVERVETLAAKGNLRLTIAPDDPALPPKVRVSLKADGAPEGIASGARLRLRARLAPPPSMAPPSGRKETPVALRPTTVRPPWLRWRTSVQAAAVLPQFMHEPTSAATGTPCASSRAAGSSGSPPMRAATPILSPR